MPRSRPLVRALLVALFATLTFAAPSPALADDQPVPQPSSDGSNAVGACLDARQVWLYVEDLDGTVVANQCVGTPQTGEDALKQAGVTIEHDDGGLICALDGRPDPCPAEFDGSFWNYWHTTPGKAWTFSDKGAADSHPEPGSIEGWCRNRPETKQCEPPNLRVVIGDEVVAPAGVAEDSLADPEVVTKATEEQQQDAGSPVGTIMTVALVVVLAGGAFAIIALRRRGDTA
ncbi:hypothetical protein [uncultured Tessaracoccus sp.]|uniref:hypothetical protein n=1 Tax=uncultured Tessaracoccus sp. TaxID=905023 RepID=UPI0025F48320|nr:hypothetical protein [uncultured Tessaracoccus sp.]